MVKGSDNPPRSVQAIYRIWQRKKSTRHFPAIPGDYPRNMLDEYINEHLFKTGYIHDWEYDSEYAGLVDGELGKPGLPVEVDMKRMLEEIFNQ